MDASTWQTEMGASYWSKISAAQQRKARLYTPPATAGYFSSSAGNVASCGCTGLLVTLSFRFLRSMNGSRR